MSDAYTRTAYTIYNGAEWGVYVTDGPNDSWPSFYWPDREVPTQQERADQLRVLGYELISPWAWQESPTEIHTLHTVMATATVRPLLYDDVIWRAEEDVKRDMKRRIAEGVR